MIILPMINNIKEALILDISKTLKIKKIIKMNKSQIERSYLIMTLSKKKKISHI